MNAAEIRAEAIDRIARCMDYYVAEAAVDALGDLLPTETVWAIAWVNQYGEHERQTSSIESRADAERFGAQYEERHPHLTTSLQVEHQYLTAWSPDA